MPTQLVSGHEDRTILEVFGSIGSFKFRYLTGGCGCHKFEAENWPSKHFLMVRQCLLQLRSPALGMAL